MNLVLTPDARADIAEAHQWYEDQREGLGNEFLERLRDCLDLIKDFPRSCPLVRRNVRRAIMRPFPYCVFYFEYQQNVVIVAVFQGVRGPRFRRKRLG